MKKVYAGEVILIDWMNKIKTAMSIGFTLKNGEKLLEYYFIPVVQSDVELVWSFSVFNPYLERSVLKKLLALSYYTISSISTRIMFYYCILYQI